MRTIPLSAIYRCKNSGRFVAIVDDEDYGFLSQFNWIANMHRDRAGVNYVRARRTDRSTGATVIVNMHRVVWERAHGPVPPGMTVDHIEHGEHGGLDNRRCNLRLASRRDQQGNRRKQSHAFSSQYKGVSFERRTGKWCAYIRVHGKTRNCGTFATEVDAARSYDRAARREFGQFAKVNFASVAS